MFVHMRQDGWACCGVSSLAGHPLKAHSLSCIDVTRDQCCRLYVRRHWQVNQQLELDSKAGVDVKYASMDKWAKHLQAVHNTVIARLQ